MTVQRRPPAKAVGSGHPHIQMDLTNTPRDCVIAVTGEWDMATRHFADACLREAIRQAERRTIIIDLEGLEFAGVEAVHTLSAAARRLADQARSLVIRLPEDGPVRLLFEKAGALNESGGPSGGFRQTQRWWPATIGKSDWSRIIDPHSS